MARRYIRTKAAMRTISERVEKAKRVLGLPEKVECKVCFKKIDTEKAIWQDGKGAGHRGYWYCKEHNSTFQLNPERFTRKMRLAETEVG